MGKEYLISGHNVAFPHDSAYPAQIQMMSKMIDSLVSGRNALLECPTGTGKSAALLAAALAWHRQYDPSKDRARRNKNKEGQSASITARAGFVNGGETEDGMWDDIDDEEMAMWEGREGPVDEDAPTPEHDAPDRKSNKSSNKAPMMYIASRTHTQITQLVRELKKAGNTVPMAVLGSRRQLCIHQEVNRPANRDSINESCRRLVQDGGCEHYNRVKALRYHPALKKGAWDIEDLVTAGKECGGCPFYAAREQASQVAQVVFCPYNYIIDPVIRDGSNINLKDAVVIIDEAHNIADVARDAASLDLPVHVIQETASALSKQDVASDSSTTGTTNASISDSNASLQAFSDMADAVIEWVGSASTMLSPSKNFGTRTKSWTGNDLLEQLIKMQLGPGQHQRLAQAMRREEEREKRTQRANNRRSNPGSNNGTSSATPATAFSSIPPKSLKVIEQLVWIGGQICSNGVNHHANQYQLVLEEQRRHDGVPVLILHFWCLTGAVAFSTLSSVCRSVVLISGTLSPMKFLSSELGATFENTLEAPHVIDVRQQLWVGSVSLGLKGESLHGTYKGLQSLQFQDAIGEVLLECCRCVPDGVLMFAPSYHVMDTLIARWKSTGVYTSIQKQKHVVVEPRKDNGKFEKTVKNFYAKCDPVARKKTCKTTGAIMFAVCRGKVAEGVDFADHRARCVVVVGIPYPNARDEKVQFKKEFNNNLARSDRRWQSGEEWYSQSAYRALNQAVGRCIRHKYDSGAILLLDDRYSKHGVEQNFSKWLRPSMQRIRHASEAIASLESFQKRLATNPPTLPPRPPSTNTVTSASSTALGAVHPHLNDHTSTRDDASTNPRTVPVRNAPSKQQSLDRFLYKPRTADQGRSKPPAGVGAFRNRGFGGGSDIKKAVSQNFLAALSSPDPRPPSPDTPPTENATPVELNTHTRSRQGGAGHKQQHQHRGQQQHTQHGHAHQPQPQHDQPQHHQLKTDRSDHRQDQHDHSLPLPPQPSTPSSHLPQGPSTPSHDMPSTASPKTFAPRRRPSPYAKHPPKVPHGRSQSRVPTTAATQGTATPHPQLPNQPTLQRTPQDGRCVQNASPHQRKTNPPPTPAALATTNAGNGIGQTRAVGESGRLMQPPWPRGSCHQSSLPNQAGSSVFPTPSGGGDGRSPSNHEQTGQQPTALMAIQAARMEMSSSPSIRNFINRGGRDLLADPVRFDNNHIAGLIKIAAQVWDGFQVDGSLSRREALSDYVAAFAATDTVPASPHYQTPNTHYQTPNMTPPKGQAGAQADTSSPASSMAPQPRRISPSPYSSGRRATSVLADKQATTILAHTPAPHLKDGQNNPAGAESHKTDASTPHKRPAPETRTPEPKRAHTTSLPSTDTAAGIQTGLSPQTLVNRGSSSQMDGIAGQLRSLQERLRSLEAENKQLHEQKRVLEGTNLKFQSQRDYFRGQVFELQEQLRQATGAGGAS